ncbi:MAG: hypothetical protein JWP74_1123 [Marmoricola sp.]|nr:hypothetical protein [Marmoricola sp.]
MFLPSGRLDLTRPVVVIDDGGPGLDPLAQAAASSAYAGLPNAAVVMEPWVLGAVRSPCQSALDRYLTAVREGPVREVRARVLPVVDGCGPELAAEREFVTHGLARVRAGLRGLEVPRVVFLGTSFGAERVARAALPADRMVLVAPYVAGDSLDSDAIRRAARAVGVLGLSASDQRLIRSLSRHLPVRLPGRSVLFTATDLDAAVTAATYDPAASRRTLLNEVRALRDELTRGRRPGQLPWLTKAADYIEGRYGRESYFRGLIGYFGNYCPVQGRRPSSANGEPTSSRFLRRFHLLCDEVPGLVGKPVSRARGCLVASVHDPVASPLARVRRRFPRVVTAEVPGRGHATRTEVELGARLAFRLEAGSSLSCASQ